MHRPELAVRLGPLLDSFSDDLAANVMSAGIAGRRRDTAAYAAAMERVRGQLSQADALSVEDRLRLVTVLAVGGQANPARGQLQALMARLDERSLRHLTGGALADLIALTEALGVAWPDQALQSLARTLLPPAKRQSRN
jgi:hypothetical protein